MVNFSNTNLFPRRITSIYYKIKHTTSKIQRTSASIGFIEQAKFHKFIPCFAKVKGQFLCDKEKLRSSNRILLDHLHKHKVNLQNHVQLHRKLVQYLHDNIGYLLTNFLLKKCRKELSKQNFNQLKTKNKKIKSLIPRKNIRTTEVPIINLSSFENLHTKPLLNGLHHSFIDKNKYVKKEN